MKDSALSSSTNDNFSSYMNVIREKISQLICNPEFVGHVDFQVNIFKGDIKNLEIGNKESIKI